jgi:hypothetical protein
MADLLANIKKGLADGSLLENESQQASPIVDEALALVSNTEIAFQERLAKIYTLVDKAAAAGGIEKQRCGYVIESLYAQANETELDLLNQYQDKA